MGRRTPRRWKSTLGAVSAVAVALSVVVPGASPAAGAAATVAVAGLDVASYQGAVDWGSVALHGARFAYVKAAEGTYYTNPEFAQQYQGSYHAGIIRGAYHFAVPDNSSGATQADFFVANGGAWSADHQTLPGMVDLEYNPYGPECYGLAPAQMVGWIDDFVTRYHSRTGRWPVIYTTAGWWDACTGASTAFAGNDPLFIANYNGTAEPLAAGWGAFTFWQFADSGPLPGDQDVFAGTPADLVALADGVAVRPPVVTAPGVGPANPLGGLGAAVGGLLSGLLGILAHPLAP